ncbi:MAG: nicotinamide-nucleotide adenylyltransferase [Thermoplasmatota archaeon]|jgi:nicotinamide-nucleotide adenylyltransferase
MNALFIGRFQPFHKGHLKVIKNASKKYDKIIIGIGSSQYSNTLKNPFTEKEREMMIKRTLENTGIKNYEIILIPDINNPPKWVDHVLSIFSDFDIIITNNPVTKNLFSEKGFIVKETKLYKKNKYSGEEIRKKMINDEKWKHSVPKEVYDLIIEINAVDRIKNLSK